MIKVNTRTVVFFSLTGHGRRMVVAVGELLIKTERILMKPRESNPRHVFKNEVLNLVPDNILFLGLT